MQKLIIFNYMDSKQIIISDFDDTILPGSDRVFEIVFKNLLGNDEFERMKSQCKNGSYVEHYIRERKLTKEDVEAFWNKFKESELYKKFSENVGEKFTEIEKNAKKIIKGEIGTDIIAFYINHVITPLVVLADIYLFELRPHEEFFEFYQQAKEKGNIVIINTMKSQAMITIELKEFALFDKKYKIFQEMIDDELVFGTTEESCKLDEKRIQYILKQLSLKCNQFSNIVIMGDSGTDVGNFEEVVQTQSVPVSFLLVTDKYDVEPADSSLKILSLKKSSEELTVEHSKLKEIKAKLLARLRESEQKRDGVKILSGQYEKILSGRYRDIVSRVI